MSYEKPFVDIVVAITLGTLRKINHHETKISNNTQWRIPSTKIANNFQTMVQTRQFTPADSYYSVRICVQFPFLPFSCQQTFWSNSEFSWSNSKWTKTKNFKINCYLGQLKTYILRQFWGSEVYQHVWIMICSLWEAWLYFWNLCFWKMSNTGKEFFVVVDFSKSAKSYGNDCICDSIVAIGSRSPCMFAIDIWQLGVLGNARSKVSLCSCPLSNIVFALLWRWACQTCQT